MKRFGTLVLCYEFGKSLAGYTCSFRCAGKTPCSNDIEDLGGLMLPDICLTGEEKWRKNLT